MPALPTFIFAGGGTGGHLYPGLAIAEQLKALHPDLAVHFVCSDRPIDRTVLTPEGVPYTPLRAKPVGLKPRTLTRFLWNWPASVRATREVIRHARTSGHVHLVAMGGFVAAPAVQAARAERVPFTLVNLDAAPGKANRWIATRTRTTSFTTVTDPRYPSWQLVNPIVRRAAVAGSDQHANRRALGLDPHRPTLMVTGGSQGATSINRFMVAFASQHAATLKAGHWQVLHQTGSGEDQAVADAYAKAGIDALVLPFTRDMGRWWGAADLALTRAGAGAVAEAWCNRVAALFLPYPYHTDNHQALNAAELTRRGAAKVVKDHVSVEANLADAGVTLGNLLADPTVLGPLQQAAASLPPADGAATIALALADSAGFRP